MTGGAATGVTGSKPHKDSSDDDKDKTFHGEQHVKIEQILRNKCRKVLNSVCEQFFLQTGVDSYFIGPTKKKCGKDTTCQYSTDKEEIP